MEDNGSDFKVEKLSGASYHVWKQKILLVLTVKDLDHFRTEDPPSHNGGHEGNSISKWACKDRKVQAIISLSMSDEYLEHVRDSVSAKDMWEIIKNVFERRTLLNTLSSGRHFYTVIMEAGEEILTYLNRVKHLAATLKVMDVVIDDKEMEMAVLNWLSPYETLIIALDALGSDNEAFSYDLVKS